MGLLYDVVFVGDFDQIPSPRLCLRALASAGHSAAIVSKQETGLARQKRRYQSRACKVLGFAELQPGRQIEAHLLILIWPLTEMQSLPFQARRTVVFVPGFGEGLDQASISRASSVLAHARDLTWMTETSAAMRQLAELSGRKDAIKADLWPLIVDADCATEPIGEGGRLRPVVGQLTHEAGKAPRTETEGGRFLLRRFGDDSGRLCTQLADDPRAAVFREGEISKERFAGTINFLDATPADLRSNYAEALVATALARGVIVFLLPKFRKEYGRAAVYANTKEVAALVRQYVGDPASYRAQAGEGRRLAVRKYDSDTFLARLGFSRPLGRPELRSRVGVGSPAIDLQTENDQTVLFLSSNGVGLGHLTRLMAIARRCPPHIRPVFMTMAPGIDKVVEAGWHCEYLNAPSQVDGPYRHWNRYLRQEVDGIMEFHTPSVLVFDGNSLPHGLVEIVRARPEVGLVWVRRGMWSAPPTPARLRELSRQRNCDLVIEPGELAAERDLGATSSLDHVQTPVSRACLPPITYLDPEEALPRAEARRALGLKGRKVVLVTFGGDALSDHYELSISVVAAFRRLRNVQIVVARHELAEGDPPPLDRVETVDVFPLSRYLRAFDGVVASAGYNTFHELMGVRARTLFIPTEAEGLDSQITRAAWAAERGLASLLTKGELDRLPQATWELLHGNSSPGAEGRPWIENGAAKAASLVAKLASRYGRPRPQ